MHCLRAGVSIAMALLATAGRAVRGQPSTFVISVADAGSGAPIEHAQVRIPALGRLARADWLGEARIAGVPRGSYTVEVRAMGYAPSDITLPVSGDSIGAVFMLQHVPMQLDTVRVTAQGVPIRLQPFEERRRMGFGHYLTDSMLTREGTRSVGTVLISHLPGLRLDRDPDYPTNWKMVSAGTSGDAWDLKSVGTGICNVDVYLDGFPLVDNIESLFATDLAGVELYDMASAPAQYRNASPMGIAATGKSSRKASCKVLLLWSKY